MSNPTYMVRNFLKYTVIFNEGSKGDSAYLLREGRVELSKEINGKKKVLAILRPLSLFGEMAVLLGDQKRTASAVALEDCKVVEIKKDDFEEFVKQSPQIMQTVLDVLVHRLKVATVKSMQVPSAFHGVSQMLGLFALHGVEELDYLNTTKAVAHSFVISPAKVNAIFNTLANLQMIEMRKHSDGSKRIGILEMDSFVAKAVQRLRTFKEEGGEEDDDEE
ncbi:MAG: cyclic nucleotide-binding domain-containing protein [Desulfovibrionaceae bacterium]|jgi:CRP-like cAMP-binding protein|nr:cyclic nucleotide-binding domain-containing protein [Desulfovibrionaceae bacterium]